MAVQRTSKHMAAGWLEWLGRRLLGESLLETRIERDLRRLIRKAPHHGLAGAPEGVAVSVTGTVRGIDDRLLEAPLTGRACVYYAIRIEDLRSLGESAMTLDRVWESVPFVLEDGRAHALVEPAHARISVAFDHASESKAAFDADPRQRALLVDRNLVDRNWFNTSGLRYHEAVICAGDRVVVLGAGTREPDPMQPPGTYRDTPTRMRFAGTSKHPLVICDCVERT